MDEELRKRFIQQKLDDILNDNFKPLPTLIIEEEDPKFLELIRPFVMFSLYMIPYLARCVSKPTRERLETKRIKDYGCLYILVNPN